MYLYYQEYNSSTCSNVLAYKIFISTLSAKYLATNDNLCKVKHLHTIPMQSLCKKW